MRCSCSLLPKKRLFAIGSGRKRGRRQVVPYPCFNPFPQAIAFPHLSAGVDPAMATSVFHDPMIILALETQSSMLVPDIDPESSVAVCDCCGLTEECTPGYIERVRERHHGKWICGLCAEAVKDEILRNDKSQRAVGTEEALAKLRSFCKRSSDLTGPSPNPTELLISAVRQILKRGLESRSAPASPSRNLTEIPGVRTGVRS